jgi:UDP-N-acetylglucosamine 2-epimerase (non-hydrolysing)
MTNLVETLNALAKQYDIPIIVSTHPRTKKILDGMELGRLNPHIQLLKPFGFCDYIKLQMEALCVISDSGTISEESNILGLRTVLLRYSTEHPETIDAGSVILGNIDWKNLETSISVALKLDNNHSKIVHYEDANFSEKVCKIISGYHSIINKMCWMK